MHWIPKFSVKLLSDAFHWCKKKQKVSEPWVIDERKERGGVIKPGFPFYLILLYQAWQLHLLDNIFIVFILSDELDEEYIAMFLHCIYIDGI